MADYYSDLFQNDPDWQNALNEAQYEQAPDDWFYSWDDPSTWGGQSSGIDWSGLLSGAGNLLGNIGGALTSPTGIGTIANLGGGYLNTQAAKEAAAIQAQGQIEAARIAAEAQKFRPVGVTTSFGQSQFGYDDQGRLTSAGYQLAPGLQAQQDALMGASGGMLNQYLGAQQATAPMGEQAQRMMQLGGQYLATSPQEQAQKYMQDQMAALAPSRASDLAALQAQLQAQGRGGLAIGGDAGMAAANPQLQAYYNSLRQQDLNLAAQATQGGMDYAKFGAGMTGLGGDMLQNMYGVQNAAFSPYQTALGGAQMLEGLGQNAMNLGTSLGSTVSAAAGRGGELLGTGMMNAANTRGQVAQQAGSTWGNILQGGASAFNDYQRQQAEAQRPIYNVNWG